MPENVTLLANNEEKSLNIAKIQVKIMGEYEKTASYIAIMID